MNMSIDVACNIVIDHSFYMIDVKTTCSYICGYHDIILFPLEGSYYSISFRLLHVTMKEKSAFAVTLQILVQLLSIENSCDENQYTSR